MSRILTRPTVRGLLFSCTRTANPGVGTNLRQGSVRLAGYWGEVIRGARWAVELGQVATIAYDALLVHIDGGGVGPRLGLVHERSEFGSRSHPTPNGLAVGPVAGRRSAQAYTVRDGMREP